MSNVLFLGDLHAGHNAIPKYRTQFESEQEHFRELECRYYAKVSKRDIVYFTGDAVFTKERLDRIAQWPGKKILVVGNHDLDSLTMQDLCNAFDKVVSFVKYHEFWLSHAPIHPNELRGKVNIHGHVHSQTIDDIRYVNTSLENTNFNLISLHEIRVLLQQRLDYYSREGLGLNYKTLDKVYKIPVGLK